MDLRKIERLIAMVEKSSMVDFSIEDQEIKISMSRRGSKEVMVVANQEVPPAESKESESAPEKVESFITSPIVGTFYSSPSPTSAPFVQVGDVIKAGTTVCILEAMKLMNEIESEFECEIEAILVSNEQKVEYGQPLFRVRALQ